MSMDRFVEMKSALPVAESGGRCRKARLGVWRKVSESEALAVEGVPESDDECGGRCRKARLGVWRKVPESEAWSVEGGAGKRGLECGGRYHVSRPQKEQ